MKEINIEIVKALEAKWEDDLRSYSGEPIPEESVDESKGFNNGVRKCIHELNKLVDLFGS